MVGTWILAIRHRMYFTELSGQNIFGEHTPFAAGIARELEMDLENRIRTALPEEAFLAAAALIYIAKRRRTVH